MNEPEFNTKAFNCPNCNAYAQMHWSRLSKNEFPANVDTNIYLASCEVCNRYSLWINSGYSTKMIYPNKVTAPLPNPDMPEIIKKDFEEARQVAPISTRAACALLRLAVQKLLSNIGEKGNNINEDIQSLVDKGMSQRIQKALDIVRVTGNNAVHPGKLDEKDIQEVCDSLFDLVNLIVTSAISTDKEVDAIYNKLPKGALDAIAKR